VKDRYFCKGAAAQIIIHEHGGSLFRFERDFNFFQVPSEKVVIGIAWVGPLEIAVALWTRYVFSDFFQRVQDEFRFFQTVLVDKTEASKLFKEMEEG